MGVRILAGILLLMAGILVFTAPALQLEDSLGDPGPALLPRIAGICMAALSLILFLQTPQQPEDADEALEKRPVIVLSLLAIPLYYLAFQWLGYTLATALYLFAAFCLLGGRQPTLRFRYGLVAAAFSLASGLIFARLLNLPLPGVLP